ncbi:NAD(P)H-hydrate dehydratase [Sulfitobacter sp. TBRI5]|uniref:NAD(P)H-hydrate dehydratase n=1 Tax=Sulfitobacter sp. TBRI5 TaxID=2989732 RepID=UPI003D9BE687
MSELLTAAQMREIEQAAMQSGDVSELELMERAGRGVFEAICERWPEAAGRGASPSRSPKYLEKDEQGFKAVVLCGPGNNGGDGFVVARLLREAGAQVRVFLLGDMEKLPDSARKNCARWLELGDIDPFDVAHFPPAMPGEPDIYVDALFGTGLTRPVQDSAPLRALAADRVADVVAIDCVSGLDLDSGRFLTANGATYRRAALTVTFHAPKRGHYLAEGAVASGQVVVKDIGISRDIAHAVPGFADQTRRAGEYVFLAPQDGDDQPVWRDLDKGDAGPAHPHKYDFGHAFILSGGVGKTGAARLAARGALRIGAGLVTLGVPPDAQAEVASQITALMMRPVADGADLGAVLQDVRINALCLGPGLGVDAHGQALVQAALEAERKPALVLDADALTLMAEAPALLDRLHAGCVLTPHAGEFTRLFPDIANRLAAPARSGPAYSKVDATRAAAQRAGCVVLFKGADTVIAAPDGHCVIHAATGVRSAPWLATAGSGDVLAGFTTGLLARRFEPLRAAQLAAWLHVECARQVGAGLIAEDLSEHLPAVFRDLGL